MASKGYDIVETSKMAMEYDGSLIDVEHVANGALENGRLVTITAGKIVYAASTDTTPIYLHCSVEKMYDTSLGLGDFRIEDGGYARIARMRVGDQFATTAFSGAVADGDLVIINDAADHDGELIVKNDVTIATANFVGRIITANYPLGFGASSLGFTKQAGILLEVVKA